MKDSNEKKLMRVVELLTEAFEILATIDEGAADKIINTIKAHLGRDASPKDLVKDELGCAESVSNIINKIVGDFPTITGTWTLYDRLNRDPRFSSVITPQPGDIIISPTGTLANAPFPGHVGFVSHGGKVISNDSETGLMEENYTLLSWRRRWGRAGYPVYFFRINQDV